MDDLMQTNTTREAVLDAYLRLMAKRPYHEVSLRNVADAAGISLSELRRTFASEEELLTAFAARTDAAMLEEVDRAAQPDSARARVLGAMMARLQVLTPHKAAVHSILMGASRDPATTLFFNRVSVEEHRWTLIAAGLDHRGARARNLAEAVSQAFVTAAAIWLEERDAALPRTRAALDQAFAYSDDSLAAFRLN